MSAQILIIEDEPDQAEMLEKFLSAWGYEIRIAYDGKTALAFAKTYPPDLILLDLYLPDIPGMEVLQKLKAEKPLFDVPIFIVSGHDSEEIRIVAMSNGASDFIKKPVQMANFAMKIQQALELASYKKQITELNAKLEKEKKRLLRYFSADLVEKILNEEVGAELGGIILPATILFFDIRGSTPIAEKIGPNKYANLISALFADIMDIVFANHGSVNELLGDGLLATFGCPLSTPQDALNAIMTAYKIRLYMQEYNQKYKEEVDGPLGYGIGLASGKVFAGNIGSVRLMKYAVMGDPVNKAARIQDLTKEFHKDIIYDHATASQLPDDVDSVELPTQILRGKQERVRIYFLDSIKGEPAKTTHIHSHS